MSIVTGFAYRGIIRSDKNGHEHIPTTPTISNTTMQMYDILQQDPEIWRLFTCAKEYGKTFRDGYGRFPHYMSSYREPFEPRASQYLTEQGYHPEYPDGQPFAVCLTQDIDRVYRSTLSKGYTTLFSLKNGDLAKALASARQAWSNFCLVRVKGHRLRGGLPQGDRVRACESIYYHGGLGDGFYT